MPDKNKLQRALNLLQSIDRDDASNQSFDLDNWITDFENGFPRFSKNSPAFKEHYWGLGLDNRPKIYELNVEADAQQIEGYRLIEFLPNRDNKEESYLLFGTPLELMSQCSQLMNQWLMLQRNASGDEFLGYPVNEYLRMKPRVGLSITVWLTTKKNPPFYKKGTDFYSARQISIPLVDKTKITYSSIRSACGGDSGLNWGEWQARAYLSPDDDFPGLMQMVAGGSTEKKAEENLQRFLSFTKGKVRGLNFNKINYSKGDRALDPFKNHYDSFDVYPAWIAVLNTKLVRYNDRRMGAKTLTGKQIQKKKKLYTYQSKEPLGWQSTFQDLSKDYFG